MPESLMLQDKTGLLHEINLKETPTGNKLPNIYFFELKYNTQNRGITVLFSLP